MDLRSGRELLSNEICTGSRRFYKSPAGRSPIRQSIACRPATGAYHVHTMGMFEASTSRHRDIETSRHRAKELSRQRDIGQRIVHPLTFLALLTGCQARSPVSESAYLVEPPVGEGTPPPAARVPSNYAGGVTTAGPMPTFKSQSDVEDYYIRANTRSNPVIVVGEVVSSRLVRSYWSVRGPLYPMTMYEVTLTVKEVLKGSIPGTIGTILTAFSPAAADGRLEVEAKTPYTQDRASHVREQIQIAAAGTDGGIQ